MIILYFCVYKEKCFLTLLTGFYLCLCLNIWAAPNKANGLDLDKYSWGQSLQEVTINIPVPPGTKSRLIACEIKKNHLKVGLKGQPPIIDVSSWSFIHSIITLWYLSIHFDRSPIYMNMLSTNPIYSHLCRGNFFSPSRLMIAFGAWVCFYINMRWYTCPL